MKSSILLGILLLTGIVIHAQTPTCQWAKGFGSAFLGGGQSIAVDGEGNVYTTGYFNSTMLIFGNDTLINEATNGAQNMFVAKFDSAGNELWAKSAGGGANEGTENVTAAALGVDGSGNVYVLGSYETPIVIFGNDTLVTANFNTFLVKYNPQGQAVWAVNQGGTLNNAYNMVVDRNGNSYICGAYTSGSIIGGADTLPFNSNVVAAYVIEYDSAGNSVWAASINGDVVLNDAVTIDGAGNVYVTGQYNGDSAVIGHTTLINTGAEAMYTVKYDAAGHVAWAQNVSVSGNINPTAITTDGPGSVYVTGGTTSDTLIFGGDTAFTFSTSALNNIFVARYDTSGNIKWVRCTQNSNDVYSSGIAAAAGGDIYVTGQFQNNSLQIGSTTLVNNDTINLTQAMFLAAYDTSGNVVWATGGLTAKDDIDGGGSLCIGKKGHLYLSGVYEGPSVVLSPDTLTFAGDAGTSSSVFVAKFDLPQTSTGITNPVNSAEAITVYPNPSTGRFCFKGISSGGVLQVYDMLGQNIYSTIATGDNYWLNLNTQAKGIYFYRVVENNAAVQEGKIVVE